MSLEGAADRGDEYYQTQLGAILRQRDVPTLRSFLAQHARDFGDDRQVEAIAAQSDLELGQLMHRMILARADMTDVHAASRAALGMDPALKKRASRPPRRRR